MTAEIISVGTELLLGNILNTNAQYLSRELADLGITDGLKATCYPGQEQNMGSAVVDSSAAFVVSGNLITGASAGCAVPFGLALVEALKGRETAEKIKDQIVIR